VAGEVQLLGQGYSNQHQQVVQVVEALIFLRRVKLAILLPHLHLKEIVVAMKTAPSEALAVGVALMVRAVMQPLLQQRQEMAGAQPYQV
jgi:hypothetical protein